MYFGITSTVYWIPLLLCTFLILKAPDVLRCTSVDNDRRSFALILHMSSGSPADRWGELSDSPSAAGTSRCGSGETCKPHHGTGAASDARCGRVRAEHGCRM